MQTIISRALTDLDIKPVPSRRCFALIGECTLSTHFPFTDSIRITIFPLHLGMLHYDCESSLPQMYCVYGFAL